MFNVRFRALAVNHNVIKNKYDWRLPEVFNVRFRALAVNHNVIRNYYDELPKVRRQYIIH